MLNTENQAFKILIVDDDNNVLELLDAILTTAGFDVDVAESGRDAIIKLKKTKFDCMTTDMKMPDMSGIELMQEALLLQPGIPIIILSATSSKLDAIKAIKAGTVDYMHKPCDRRELVDKLNSMLSGNQKSKV